MLFTQREGQRRDHCLFLFAVRVRMLLARFGSVFGSMGSVAMGQVGMMSRRFVITCLVMFRRFLVMPGCVIEMFGGLPVVLMRRCVFRMRFGHVLLHLRSVLSIKSEIAERCLRVPHAEPIRRLTKSMRQEQRSENRIKRRLEDTR
jgi:hypothetical protein